MKSFRQVIQLGVLADSVELPSGQKDIYYIYYRSDKDLYMYDSYHDKEYNLFRLQPKPKGKLTIIANSIIRGFLNIFSSKSSTGKITINSTRTTLVSDGGDLKVIIKQSPATKGILIITAYSDIQRGSIQVRVRDAAGSKGTLTVTSTRDFGKGNIEVHLYDNTEVNGNLVITSTRDFATGNIQVNVRDVDIAVVENGNLIITSTHDFDRGNIQIIVKQP